MIWKKFIFKMLLNKTHQELFDDYLKENNLYTSFYKNIQKQQSKINFTNGIVNAIFYSFHWSSTTQGYVFQRETYIELSIYLIKLLNNLQNE